MKKGVIIAIIAAVVVAGGAVVWAMNNDSKDEPAPETVNDTNITEDTTNTTNTTENQPSSDNNASETSEVEIEDFAFTPANITVKKGTKVTWTNKDSTVHTATSTSGPADFDSGDLSQDQSFSFTFNVVGTYNYHCTPHPQMTGTVTVTE